MFIFYTYFEVSIGGLFSSEYRDAPWTLGKIADMINHMWVPIIVIGTLLSDLMLAWIDPRIRYD